MDLTEDHFVSVRQACEVAGVSRRTIYNWYAAGRLETQRTPGGNLRIRVGSLTRRDERNPRREG